MDGRLAAGLLTLALPAGLIGVTYAKYNSNPLAVLVLLVVMIAGAVYLLTYPDSF